MPGLRSLKTNPKIAQGILVADRHMWILYIIDIKTYKFEEPHVMNNYSSLNLPSIQLFRTVFSPFLQEQELIFVSG